MYLHVFFIEIVFFFFLGWRFFWNNFECIHTKGVSPIPIPHSYNNYCMSHSHDIHLTVTRAVLVKFSSHRANSGRAFASWVGVATAISSNRIARRTAASRVATRSWPLEAGSWTRWTTLRWRSCWPASRRRESASYRSKATYKVGIPVTIAWPSRKRSYSRSVKYIHITIEINTQYLCNLLISG